LTPVAANHPAVGMVTMGFGNQYAGGAEHQAQLLAETLAWHGRRVVVYAPSASSRDMDAKHGVKLVRVPSLGFPGMRTATYLPMLTLSQLLPRSEHPPILHTHMAWLHALVPEFLQRLQKRRTIVKIACSGDDGDISSLRRSPLGRLVLGAILRADRIVALTPSIADEVLALGYPANRIREIPNGVLLPISAKPAPDLDHLTRPIVLFAGRLTEQKGIVPFIDTWPAIRESAPTATLVIAGGGELSAEVSERANRHDMQASIRLLGHRRDIDGVLAASDLVVIPSRSEGMSNVALQALASGRPVVGFDIPGVRDVVGYERATVPSGDFMALARLVSRVLGNPGLLNELAEVGHRHVARHFAIDRVASQYEELYDELA
jgi:glycosyltransferase involved in cell wall biosynthesis